MSGRSLRIAAGLATLLGAPACAPKPAAAPPASYLYVWVGDSAKTASDFLAVIDAAPDSPTYGSVVSTLAVGQAGSSPHHTEAEMPASGHLLANGFGAGRTWLVDFTTPRTPKLLTQFDDRAGFSHPHSFLRLANGNLLATFQYAADSSADAMASHDHAGMPGMGGAAAGASSAASDTAKPQIVRTTGGLVEMDERGTVIRSGTASDTTIRDRLIYPYSVLAIPSMDRAVSTTTDMNAGNLKSTAEWVQFWKLNDLTLLRSIALKPGPRGDEHQLTGEPRLLSDGRSVYVHTFMCGLYLVRNVDQPEPVAEFVHGFQGKDCGVPVLTGRYWLQTVPEAHALIAMDISDATHPREVSRVTFDSTEHPHWAAIDASGRRVTVNSAEAGSRIHIVNLDPTTGVLTLDARFRDAGASREGVSLTSKTLRSGFTGTAVPHGSVFSR